MGMQFYASPEQIMRDRSEYARKGIARGRSVIVLTYAEGVLFVAENPSSALHKVAEIYDRIAFAAVGKYNEFENLRVAGIRLADLRGYSYDRRDVTGRGLANAYAQTLGSIFTEQSKPYEVEICVAEVGDTPADDQLYRLTYDGSVGDEPGFVAMGGQSEQIATRLRADHRDEQSLESALHLAVAALANTGSDNGAPREIPGTSLEVAVLDRTREGRRFRRITGTRLEALLASQPAAAEPPAGATPDEPTPPPPPADPDGS
ncbi:MAG: proteasome subunit alpha [Mycobacteriales bacterium]